MYHAKMFKKKFRFHSEYNNFQNYVYSFKNRVLQINIY